MFKKGFSKKCNFLVILLLFFSMAFFCIFLSNNYNSFFNSNFIDINLNTIKSNKVIVIGDSRFKHIIRDKDNYTIPSNFTFIAESAKDIKWFKTEALDSLYSILDSDDIYSYHVVINMGVNDIQFSRPFDDQIEAYKEQFKKLVNDYPYVKFYFLSVNPIDEEMMDIYYPGNLRTNSEIMYFNKEMLEFTTKYNINYCSSFDSVYFNIPDGIHYDHDTNQRIIDYINNDCVKFDLLDNRWNYG